MSSLIDNWPATPNGVNVGQQLQLMLFRSYKVSDGGRPSDYPETHRRLHYRQTYYYLVRGSSSVAIMFILSDCCDRAVMDARNNLANQEV
jgi:hypothetical protein